MGQIVKSVCVCQSVCQSVSVSVCEHSRGRISWSIFTKIGTDIRTPKNKNEFIRGSISHHRFLYFAIQNPHFRPSGPENQRKYEVIIYLSDFRPEVKIWPFRACVMHPAIIIGTIPSLWTWLCGRCHVPQNALLVFLPRCMECRRGLAMIILSVRLSVCLSVTRVNCDKTVERSVQIFMPYERSFSLVYWEEEWLVGGDPFYLKFWVNRLP